VGARIQSPGPEARTNRPWPATPLRACRWPRGRHAHVTRSGHRRWVHDLNLFQLEGNVADNNGGDDWANIYADGGSALKSVFVFDDGADGIDDLDEINWLGGGSKDDLDIPNWEWDTSPVPDKNDIINAGAALYSYTGSEICPTGHTPGTGDPLCTRPGDPIMYYFLDRFSGGTGDADVGFWFFEGTHGLVPSASDPTKGTFQGVHTPGDILILSEFTIGGGVSTVVRWLGDASGGADSIRQPAAGAGRPAAAIRGWTARPRRGRMPPARR
jgi:hypothetical protein